MCRKQEGLAAQEKVDDLTKEVKALREENKSLSDNYNSERVSTVARNFVPVVHFCTDVQPTNKYFIYRTYFMTLITSKFFVELTYNHVNHIVHLFGNVNVSKCRSVRSGWGWVGGEERDSRSFLADA